MNQKIKIALFTISLLGLVVSIVVHFAILIKINLQDFPISPFILHLGIFITFAPSLILFIFEHKEVKDKWGRKNLLKTLYEDSPKFLLGIVFILFWYAAVNFLFFMTSMDGSPTTTVDGKYILHIHGKVIREISFEEYKMFRRLEVRGFSGHWMLFYSAALLLSYPFRKKREPVIQEERVLVNHLRVSYTPFERRLFEKGKFLFILSGISLPLFVFFFFYNPNFFMLVVTGIFPVNLILNLYYFISWSKYFIKSYSIENDVLHIEVYKYNTLTQYHFPIKETKLKLDVTPIRGNEIVCVSCLDIQNKEIFSQYDSNAWSPNQLKDLERAVSLAKRDS